MVLDEREQQLAAIAQWSFDGKLGIRSPSDSGSVYIDWQQNKRLYNIAMVGPLGQGGGKVVNDGRKVRLERAGYPTRKAATAEALLTKELGLQVPVSLLQYWVRGLPAPNAQRAPELVRDERGLLLQQRQAGWVVDYSDYRIYDGMAMPGKVKAVSAERGLRLVLVIKSWVLSGSS